MKRRRRYYRGDDEQLITGIAVLVLLPFLFYFFTNPGKLLAYVLIVAICIVVFLFFKKWMQKKHFNDILSKLKISGQEEYLKNFITQFGLEGKKSKQGYVFRNHNFDWDRINDLKKILKEKGIISRDKDVFSILKFYIQKKEEAYTRESIHSEPQKFSLLSGSNFEKLLYRLFEKMGYRVELTGRSGDQGGDLIAVREGERVLIQAKCYRDWSTGNVAVQQVVGAMKYYDCTKAIVITTSHFTPEAISLAKANKTELVFKEQLQEMLLKYLGESWS